MAHLVGISEVNAAAALSLPEMQMVYVRCGQSKYKVGVAADMKCPQCGEELYRDGFDIPFGSSSGSRATRCRIST
ncbi:MAG: hypothetical protein ACLUI3_03105 [Christensenellales bacterium]